MQQSFPGLPVDLFNFPQNTRGDLQVFTSDNQSQNWQSWVKPRGVTMCHMICIGGGGGGGGGYATASGMAAGGGGGGACSGIARLITPAWLLPDVLYVQVGVGGLGGMPNTSSLSGTSAGTGSSGSNSFVSLGHTYAAPNVILSSNVLPPGGGGGGTGSATGIAGSVPTIATSSVPQLLGQWSAVVGLAGVAGGAIGGGAGTSVTAWTALPLTPGAGGGTCVGSAQAGGGVTAMGTCDFGFLNFPTTAGILAPGGLAGSNNGSSGVMLWQPFYMTGGGGGGANNSGTGGNGGKGGIGCGGGGGGGSGAQGGGGRGGDGGEGMVLIASW
jgi:hypothetical protein